MTTLLDLEEGERLYRAYSWQSVEGSMLTIIKRRSDGNYEALGRLQDAETGEDVLFRSSGPAGEQSVPPDRLPEFTEKIEAAVRKASQQASATLQQRDFGDTSPEEQVQYLKNHE